MRCAARGWCSGLHKDFPPIFRPLYVSFSVRNPPISLYHRALAGYSRSSLQAPPIAPVPLLARRAKALFARCARPLLPIRLGSVDPSFRALSARLKLTVRRHKFNNDSPSCKGLARKACKGLASKAFACKFVFVPTHTRCLALALTTRGFDKVTPDHKSPQPNLES